MIEAAAAVVPAAEIFDITGIQFMQFNTLFQLYAMRCGADPQLDAAATLLMLPDLFNYSATGRQAAEYTIASTSQMFEARERRWATGLMAQLGLPTRILPPVVPPGSVIGHVLPGVLGAAGLRGDVPVIAPGSHDTASAVAAVPGLDARSLYISSGTWSLMGMEIAQPIINAQTRAHNFTNEGGVDQHDPPAQEHRRAVDAAREPPPVAARGPRLQLGRPHRPGTAGRAVPLADRPRRRRLPQPQQHGRGHPRLLSPLGAAPAGDGGPGGALLSGEPGAALSRRIRRAARNYGHAGGDDAHCGRRQPQPPVAQLAADACRRPVVTGPVEATALGNVMLQAIATGHLSGVAEGRAAIAASIEQETFTPGPAAGWDEAYARFQGLLAQALA